MLTLFLCVFRCYGNVTCTFIINDDITNSTWVPYPARHLRSFDSHLRHLYIHPFRRILPHHSPPAWCLPLSVYSVNPSVFFQSLLAIRSIPIINYNIWTIHSFSSVPFIKSENSRAFIHSLFLSLSVECVTVHCKRYCCVQLQWHQTQWQQHTLQPYDSEMVLMDTTYKQQFMTCHCSCSKQLLNGSSARTTLFHAINWSYACTRYV